MYKTCMFDLDGTLANTLYSIAYFGNTALKSLGYPEVETEKYRQMVGNGADKLIRRMLKNSAGEFTEDEVTKLRGVYDELYASKPEYLVEAYPGVKELLIFLKENGIKTAVISNKPDDMTKAVIHSVFGDELFDHVQGQMSEFPHKPDPTAPLYILSLLGVSPADCLYIGDSGVDMETGSNAGMVTAGVSWGFRGAKELSEHGAVNIVDNAEELRKIIAKA